MVCSVCGTDAVEVDGKLRCPYCKSFDPKQFEVVRR